MWNLSLSLRAKRSNLYNQNMHSKVYYFYIATNKTNKVLYVGVTNNLARRIFEHKSKIAPGFTSKYNITKLVYYEDYNDINEAIKREKQVKGGSRKKKIELIIKMNPTYRDLYGEIIE